VLDGQETIRRHIKSDHGILRNFLSRHKLLLSLLYVSCVFATVISVYKLSPPQYEASAIVSLLPSEPYDVYSEKIGAQSQPGHLTRVAVALFESENVIRRAIEIVGLNNMRPTPTESVDAAYIYAKKALSVRQEGLSDFIRIKFTHPDPKLAVAFTNAIVESFTARYLRLYGNSSAVSFFVEQQKQNRLALERASAAVQEYASKNRIYQLDAQLKLLIAERSNHASALDKTRGSIVERESEVQAVPTLLSQMKPVNRQPQITGLTLPKPDKATSSHVGSSLTIDPLSSDPPLLLVRVYENTMANLVRLHTELAGLRALESHEERMLKKFDDEISSIVSKQAEYDRLEREVVYAKANDEVFTKKALELQLSQELKAKNLSSVQVIQEATMPMGPTRPWLLLAMGLGICVFPFLVMVLHRHWVLLSSNTELAGLASTGPAFQSGSADVVSSPAELGSRIQRDGVRCEHAELAP
jgi:uncharacterized protein involved in exopolysaccharide biosynthesis